MPTPAQRAAAFCQTYGLLATGGSDYHGSLDSSDVRHTELNQLHLPETLLLPLKQAAAKLRA